MLKRMAMMMLSISVLMTGFTIPAYAKEQIAVITDMWWDGEEIAAWEEMEDAYKYEVKLFRGSTEVATAKVTKEKYNFRSKMDKTGTYRFKVRALGKGDYTNSAWSGYSDSVELTSEDIKAKKNTNSSTTTNTGTATGNGVQGINGGPGLSTQSGSWVIDGNLWWYKNADGSYPKASWSLINEKWYFFDDIGYMKSGWINWNNATYYCGVDGAMLTGTHVIEGISYNFNDSGMMTVQ